MYKKNIYSVIGLIAILLSGTAYAESHQPFEPEMVQLPNGKWMGKYEVTKGQFAAFVTDSKYQTEAESGDGCYGLAGSKWEKDKKYNWRNLGFNQTDEHPVACVSWNDAQAYIKWLNGKTNKNYRLPTEEEWFAACQAGESTEYCGSNNLDEVAWYYGNLGNTTHLVGQKKANKWGLHDMSGNVWEWTSSFYNNTNTRRVVRGGSWGS
jgi:formylglycine-generating enzyme required for sulfatase activity